MTDTTRDVLRFYGQICVACAYLVLLIFVPACGGTDTTVCDTKDCRK